MNKFPVVLIFLIVFIAIIVVVVLLILLLTRDSKNINSSENEIESSFSYSYSISSSLRAQKLKNLIISNEKNSNSLTSSPKYNKLAQTNTNFDSSTSECCNNCYYIRIGVFNVSSVVNNSEVIRVMNAQQKQINEHFFPVWDLYAKLEFFQNQQDIPPEYYQISILDDSDQANALGYHSLTSWGMPFARVFARTLQNYGIPWSLTFSHEVLEMIVDPYADVSVFVRDTPTTGIIVFYEMVDPCQSLQHSYTIDGVTVADFVFPEWFGFYQSPTGKYDYMGYIDNPLTILPGGYVLAYRVPNNGSDWEIISANKIVDSNSATEITNVSDSNVTVSELIQKQQKQQQQKQQQQKQQKQQKHKNNGFENMFNNKEYIKLLGKNRKLVWWIQEKILPAFSVLSHEHGKFFPSCNRIKDIITLNISQLNNIE